MKRAVRLSLAAFLFRSRKNTSISRDSRMARCRKSSKNGALLPV
jgi:hypothetical protein